ncbi:hypothetical protein [Streptomyces sp. NPDC059224]|uniref:hypothetical protein n=1 Tax=Streptomyces sp. NPDC059224 TaxID=3346775 RepID=UPI0036CF254E
MRSRPPEYRGGTSCRSRSVVVRPPSGRGGTPRRSGTAHRHCRAHRRGHAAIGREGYVPRSWITGAGRRRSAEGPEEVGCATKPALALRMIDRTPDTGIRAARVAADGRPRTPDRHPGGQGAGRCAGRAVAGRGLAEARRRRRRRRRGAEGDRLRPGPGRRRRRPARSPPSPRSRQP